MTETRTLLRRLAFGTLAVAGVALLGGCGDDDPEDASDTTAPATTSPDTDGSPDSPDDPDGTGGAVTVVDYAFDPTPITVSAGATVTWTNEDDFPHTTTADGGDWDSDAIESSDSFEFTFEEPGTYAYFCAIHNFMKGEVVVE